MRHSIPVRCALAAGIGLVIGSALLAQNGDGDEIVRYRGIEVDLAGREIRIRGRVLLDRGLIELVATAPGGKEHESLLVLDCRPSKLQLGLILIGLEKGTGVRFPGESAIPSGEPVDIFVHWKESDGRERESPIEEFIWDRRRERTMPRRGWIFTGSRFLPHPHAGHEVFMADATGVMIVTYHDPDAILDTASPAGSDDTAYHANPKTVPAPGTAIELRIRPRPPESKEESGE